MPYKMKFFYKGRDKEDYVEVDVYQVSAVGALIPTAACYVTSESSDEDAPKKGDWLSVSCAQLVPLDDVK